MAEKEPLPVIEMLETDQRLATEISKLNAMRRRIGLEFFKLQMAEIKNDPKGEPLIDYPARLSEYCRN